MVDEGKARLLLDEAKLQLDAVIDKTNQVQATARFLLPVCITLLSALLAFSVSQAACLQWLLLPLFVYAGVLIYCAINLLNLALPIRQHCKGNIPKNLLRNDIVKHSLAKILVGQAIKYQGRIDDNDQTNATNESALKVATQLLIWTPVVLAFLTLGIASTLGWVVR